MTITASGYVSLSNIQTEFGGTNPIWMSEYYTNNASGYTTGISGLPASGTTINLSHFYGKSKAIASPNVNFTVGNAYFTENSISALPSGQGFTLSFWVRITSKPAYGYYYTVFSIKQITGNYKPAMSASIDFQGRLWCLVNMYASDTQAELCTDGFLDNNWHHVLFTISSTGLSYIYLDGTKQSQGGTWSGLSLLTTNNYCGYFKVGCDSTVANGMIGSVGQLFCDFRYSSSVTSSNFNNGGMAVNIGSSGSNVFGASPMIYLKDSGTGFGTNYGTANYGNGPLGDFTSANAANISTDGVTFMIRN